MFSLVEKIWCSVNAKFTICSQLIISFKKQIFSGINGYSDIYLNCKSSEFDLNRLKKISFNYCFIFVFFNVLCPISLFSQDSGGEFIMDRNSVSSIVIIGNDNQDQLLYNYVNNNSINQFGNKFDVNKISLATIKVSDTLNSYKNNIAKILKDNKVGNLVLKSIFFDSNNMFTFNEIEARGKKSASDSDKLLSQNLSEKESLLKSMGFQAVEMIYVVITLPGKEGVISSPNSITPQKGNTYKFSGQSFLYKLILPVDFWTKFVAENKPESLRSLMNIDFDFKLVDQKVSVGLTDQNETKTKFKDLKPVVETIPKSDSQINSDLFSSFFNSSNHNFDQYENFKTRVTIFKTLPIEAKVGLKDDLHIDQLYGMREKVYKDDNSYTFRNVGWVRVRKVGDNLKNLDSIGVTSKFYKFSGGKAKRGMQLEEKGELGMSVGGQFLLGDSNTPGTGSSIRIDQFIYFPVYGTKIGLEYGGFNRSKSFDSDFNNISIGGESFEGKINVKGLTQYLALDINKSFNIDRFEITPYIGANAFLNTLDKVYLDFNFFGTAKSVELNTQSFFGLQDLEKLGIFGINAYAGIKAGYYFSRSVQIFGGVRFITPGAGDIIWLNSSDEKIKSFEDYKSTYYDKQLFYFPSSIAFQFGIKLLAF